MHLRSKHLGIALCAMVVIALFSRVGVSEEKATNGAATPAAASTGPDAKAMEAMQKAATPGPEHAALKKMAGKFTADCTMKMAPDAPEMKSKAEQTSEMILGDRYLKMKYKGDFMGQPFNGVGLTGYDNARKKHFSTWIDDMSTGIMVSEGTADSSGKVITYTGECACPEEGGKMKPFRQVLTIINDDQYTFDMYTTPTGGGPEFKCMSITYTRVK